MRGRGNQIVAGGIGIGCLLWTAALGAVTQISTIAGLGSGDGGSIPNCTFYVPADLARDGLGNVYIADAGNQVIRQISASGTVATLAGGFGAAGFAGGIGTAARFNSPKGVAVDAAGTTLFVADTNNHVIRKITLATGVVSVVAGLGGTSGLVDGNTTNARFYFPTDLALDATGNTLFVADAGNHRIRVIYGKNPNNLVVATLAGSSQGYLDANGTSAKFNAPCGLALEPAGNTLYVADTGNHVIRQLLTTGLKPVITTAGLANQPGFANGDSITAMFSLPRGVAVDAANATLYVSDTSNHTLRRIDLTAPGKITTTLAGSGGNTGNADGLGAAAKFNLPCGLTLVGGVSLLAADTNNDAIRQVTLPGGDVATWAGGAGDGRTGSNCVFRQPTRICRDAAGNQYISDTDSHTIRKISSLGTASTLAGSSGVFGSSDGTGDTAKFKFPRGLALSPTGTTLYVADSDNHLIRKVVTATGQVTLLAGAAGVTGTADAPARFYNPQGLALSPSGQYLYVADTNNHSIRRVDTVTGAVGTVFGSSSRVAGYLDNFGTNARFSFPTDVVLDAAGNTLFVADSGNRVIRSIYLNTGEVRTLVGTAANLSNPQGVATGDGFVFFSDASGGNLFIVDPERQFSIKLAGLDASGMLDGDYSQALFNYPEGLVYSSGNLYVADGFNRRIRRVENLYGVRSVRLTPVLNNIFIASEPGQLVLQITPLVSGLDTLTALTVGNLGGTAAAPGDIKNVNVWFQEGGGTFDSANATYLGALQPAGDPYTWASGPNAFNRQVRQNDEIYILADVGDVPVASRTCQFGLPASGLVFASGTWPAAPLVNEFYQTLAPAGVTFAIYHEALLPATVVKGQARVPAMSLMLTNALKFESSIESLTFGLEDGRGNSLPAGTALAAVRVEDENGVSRGVLNVLPDQGSTLIATFPAPLKVAAGKTTSLKILVDVNSQASADSFRLAFASALSVNQGSVDCIAAANDPSGFPMITDFAHIQKADLTETYSNYPNPFQPPRQTTCVAYYLPQPATVSLTIWTLTEDKVIGLIDDQSQSAGYYTQRWDGKNGQGHLVASGVYLSRLWLRYADGSRTLLTRKIAVVR